MSDWMAPAVCPGDDKSPTGSLPQSAVNEAAIR